MKKLRERLSNKKGFTLVELIVVIVIILILATVLIPNVMRYIQSARESAFQSEASGYLTELTGYEAEYYAKYSTDMEAFPPAKESGYTLTGFSSPDTVSIKTTTYKALTGPGVADQKTIGIWLKNGAITAFTYTDGKKYVSWEQTNGWTNVDSDQYKE